MVNIGSIALCFGVRLIKLKLLYYKFTFIFILINYKMVFLFNIILNEF